MSQNEFRVTGKTGVNNVHLNDERAVSHTQDCRQVLGADLVLGADPASRRKPNPTPTNFKLCTSKTTRPITAQTTGRSHKLLNGARRGPMPKQSHNAPDSKEPHQAHTRSMDSRCVRFVSKSCMVNSKRETHKHTTHADRNSITCAWLGGERIMSSTSFSQATRRRHIVNVIV